MPWRVDLRGEDGALSNCYIASYPEALAAFRTLLARDDLTGQPVTARFVSPRSPRPIYLSRFDRDFGAGRLRPSAPLDTLGFSSRADRTTLWQTDQLEQRPGNPVDTDTGGFTIGVGRAVLWPTDEPANVEREQRPYRSIDLSVPFLEALTTWATTRGLSRARQADTLGISRTTLNGYYNGRRLALEGALRRLMALTSAP